MKVSQVGWACCPEASFLGLVQSALYSIKKYRGRCTRVPARNGSWKPSSLPVPPSDMENAVNVCRRQIVQPIMIAKSGENEDEVGRCRCRFEVVSGSEC